MTGFGDAKGRGGPEFGMIRRGNGAGRDEAWAVGGLGPVSPDSIYDNLLCIYLRSSGFLVFAFLGLLSSRTRSPVFGERG